MSDDKTFREFTIFQVLPENGKARFLAAIKGSKFVEQDAWIGYQVHVIEYSALEAERQKSAKLVEALRRVIAWESEEGLGCADWSDVHSALAEYRGEG